MRRRILLVDDEVAVLLTLKAVLEISGFDVDTAASAREGVSKLHTREYQMLITDMRMEHDVAGVEVIKAARAAAVSPCSRAADRISRRRRGLAGDGRRPAPRQAHAHAHPAAADRRPHRLARAETGKSGHRTSAAANAQPSPPQKKSAKKSPQKSLRRQKASATKNTPLRRRPPPKRPQRNPLAKQNPPAKKQQSPTRRKPAAALRRKES